MQRGFRVRGRVAHPNAPSGNGYEPSLCSNWWSQATSTVKRSVIMDDFIYSVAGDSMRIADLNDLSSTVAVVSLKSTSLRDPMSLGDAKFCAQCNVPTTASVGIAVFLPTSLRRCVAMASAAGPL